MRDLTSDAPLQPILVVLVWRGGERFQRALESIQDVEDCFKRIIFSITSAHDSCDVRIAQEYISNCTANGKPSKAEIICSGIELPTMQHQAFWIDYLKQSHASGDDWILWLAYDDQLRHSGIRSLIDTSGNWQLDEHSTYFGPWAMRHETADQLWNGPKDEVLESWTSFPLTGPKSLPVCDWVGRQLMRPTYMQMSGSLAHLRAHESLIAQFPKKKGPMRIELATALSAGVPRVSELEQPIAVIYGRSNSDRANYAKTARREDLDLALRFMPWIQRDPRGILKLVRSLGDLVIRKTRSPEAWDVRQSGVTPN
jgi:hypothetical protein